MIATWIEASNSYIEISENTFALHAYMTFIAVIKTNLKTDILFSL